MIRHIKKTITIIEPAETKIDISINKNILNWLLTKGYNAEVRKELIYLLHQKAKKEIFQNI